MQNKLLEPNLHDKNKNTKRCNNSNTGGGGGEESKYNENYTLGFVEFFLSIQTLLIPQVSRQVDWLLQKRWPGHIWPHLRLKTNSVVCTDMVPLPYTSEYCKSSLKCSKLHSVTPHISLLNMIFPVHLKLMSPEAVNVQTPLEIL